MKNSELNILDQITRNNFSSIEYIKLKKTFFHSNTTLPTSVTISNTKKRKISQAKYVKYSKFYAINLIYYINSKMEKTKRAMLFFKIANEFNEAGFNDAALKLFQEALKTINQTDQTLLGYNFLKIGKIYSEKGFRNKSNLFVKKASKIFTNLNSIGGLIQCYNLLGCNYIENCQLLEAKIYLKKCLNLLDEENNNLLRAKIEMNLAGIYLLQGIYEQSLYYSYCALLKFEKYKDISNIVMVRYNIASNFYEMGRYEEAIKEYDKSLKLSIKYELTLNAGRVYHDKARIYLKKKDTKMARAYWKKGVEIFDKTNDASLKYLLIMLKGAIYRIQGKYKYAEKYLLENRESLKKFNNKFMIADNELELGYLYRDWGKNQEALDSFNISLKLFDKRNSELMINRIKQEIINID